LSVAAASSTATIGTPKKVLMILVSFADCGSLFWSDLVWSGVRLARTRFLAARGRLCPPEYPRDFARPAPQAEPRQALHSPKTV